MKHRLAFLISCIVAKSAYAEDPIHTIFSAPANLPQTTEEWVRFLEARVVSASIRSNAKFHHQGHALGFYLNIETENVTVSRWIGISDNYLKELPSATEISDPKLLAELGVADLNLEGIRPAPKKECITDRCTYQIIGTCSEIGCDRATIQTTSKGITSVRWCFPID